MGPRDVHVRVVDAPVGLGAAPDHEFAVLEPHLPDRLRIRRVLEGQQQAHAAALAPSAASPTTARSRRSVASAARSGANQAVRPSRGLPEPGGGDVRPAQHRPQVHVERLADGVQQRQPQHLQSRAAGQEADVVGERQRADAQFDPILPPERPRAEHRPLAEHAVGEPEPALQPRRDGRPASDELLDRHRHAERAAEQPGQPLRPEHLVRQRRRLAELDWREAVPAGAGERAEHGAQAPRPGPLDLHLRALVGPGAVEQRQHPVLHHVGEVEEGGIARGALDPGGEPALRQPVEHPTRQVQRHRALRPEQPDQRHRHPGRRVAGSGCKRHHVAQRETEPHLLAEPRRLAVRTARASEAAATGLEPAQQFEEIHVRRGGALRAGHTRLRLPTVIGHDTSSWLCSSRVWVRTKAFTAA